MKETIIAFTIIGLMILTCTYTTSTSTTFCNELKDSAEKCMSAAYADDWSAVEEEIKHVKEHFDEKSPMIEMISLHQKISEVDTLILKIEAAANLRDRTLVITESNCLIGHLDTLASSDLLTLGNIL